MVMKSNAAAPVELIRIEIAEMRFTARFHWEHAPKTCAAFLAVLPFRGKLLQARWSGQAAWIPLADFDLGVGLENPKTDPAPGEILFHPADHSECEILVPYGKTVFR